MNSRRLGILLAAGALLAGLAGCRPGDPQPHDPDPITGGTHTGGTDTGSAVGELVATWSESDSRHAWVAEVASPVLLANDEEREHWLSTLPADDADVTDILAVDLGTHSLVIGTYPRCTETSVVLVEHRGEERAIVQFLVASGDEDIECDWSPVSMDVWAVPWSDTSDLPPIAVSTTTPQGESVPQPVGSLMESWDEMDADSEDLNRVMREHGPVLRTNQQRDELADALAGVLDDDARLGELRGLDLNGGLLVLVSYHRCTEQSTIWADLARVPALIWAELDSEPETVCVWSPFTIDAWWVAADEVPDRVEFGQYLPFGAWW